jgi:Glycosyl hydrolase family 47
MVTTENMRSEQTNYPLSATSQRASTHESPCTRSNNERITFSFNGWDVSIVDSIDTMILMDLMPQYEQARQHVSTIDFTHGSNYFVPFFEATIRYMGGLLSAYSLTKEPIFLSKADDIGRALLSLQHDQRHTCICHQPCYKGHTEPRVERRNDSTLRDGEFGFLTPECLNQFVLGFVST